MVRKFRCVLLLFVLIGLIQPDNTFAQIPFLSQLFDKYRFRGDRWEGIKSRIEVAGEQLEFLSALIDYEKSRTQRLEDELMLGFLSLERNKVKLTVREPSKNYWMRPVENRRVNFWRCNPGFNRFTWDTGIIKRHKISLNSLYGLAMTSKRGYKIIMPIILSDSELLGTITVKGYNFIFFSNRMVNIDYRFMEPGKDEPVYQASLNRQKGKILISWNGKDQNNQPVKDGDYLLSLDATFFYKYRPKKVFHFTYRFHHCSKIRVR
jgi:hypothetical protein